MDLAFSSATQLADAIRRRDASATEVLSAHLEQIEKRNPALNAVVTLDAERAFERAGEADAALARGESWGPLHGVPFTLKDAHCTAGMRTTAGFPPFADFVPTRDSTIAARLKAAGGVLIGKTNVPVMLADFQSDNPIFGRTNNPWNLERTPGGSSGGAAAALASGMTPFEIGSDLSSSIRLPAHFCGVFGLKATETRIAGTGFIPDPSGSSRGPRLLVSFGPMARTIDDLALLEAIIAGPDGSDTEVRPVPTTAPPNLELRDLRIAVAPALPDVPVSRSVRKAVEKLADLLGEYATVDLAAPDLDFAEQLSRGGELTEMMLASLLPDDEDAAATLPEYFAALMKRDRFINAWENFLDSWDVLLMPPAMVTAFAHNDGRKSLQVDDQMVDYFMVSAYGSLFNYTGHPAVVMPYTHDEHGLPIGIQLVGKRWSEAQLLGAAKAISNITGDFHRPSGY